MERSALSSSARKWFKEAGCLDYKTLTEEEKQNAKGFLPTESLAFVFADRSANIDVLYTATICFVDVDIDPDGLERDALRRNALMRAHRFIAVNPEFGMRCYETAAGLRLLITSHAMDPEAVEACDTMDALGVDPKYARMVERQRVFAARLDPKPHRCLPKTEHAVCRYLWSSGNPLIHPDALIVLKFHDEATGAHTERPLA